MENLELLLEEAKFYFLNQHYSKARALLEEVLQQDPTHADALYHLALLYEATREIDEAIAVLQRLLESHPDEQRARTLLSRLQRT